MTIALTEKQLQLVLEILNQYLPAKTTVWVFGSRTNLDCKPFSDLDLAMDAGEALPMELLIDLKLAFEESALPFKVDLVDWYQAERYFQERLDSYRINALAFNKSKPNGD